MSIIPPHFGHLKLFPIFILKSSKNLSSKVDANSNAKLLLDKIINDILITKKRCHFLIPEKYEKVKELNDLIDLRVIHLRKRGISHKENKGVVYNVYYLDYACYTSTNLSATTKCLLLVLVKNILYAEINIFKKSLGIPADAISISRNA